MHKPLETRRDFLRDIAAGATLAALGGLNAYAQDSPESLSPDPNPDFDPDVELELVAAQGTAQMVPGTPTRVWRFTGKVLKGDPNAFTTLSGGFVPVIRVRNRQRVRIFFRNQLPEPSIVHWHGLHIVQKMDGHPMYAIGTGQRYVYEFVVDNRPGTYWFHPHPDMRTGVQVYAGLAGLLIVDDEEDSGVVDLPSGEFEIAWILQDRLLDETSQLIYNRNRMQMMMGFTGDRILVNGRADYIEHVAATAYRVRILNGSNARFYKLAWGDGRPLTVIGSDGGLLERPVNKPYVMMAPGERVELWLDFSGEEPGTEHVLRSLTFDSGSMMGMMGMGRGPRAMGRGMRSDGNAFDVLKVRVDRTGARTSGLPSNLSTIHWPNIEEASNRDIPRTIQLQMGHMTLTLNGRTFDMRSAAPEETVKLGTTEVWEFANMTTMSHPMHVHNLQFKVLERIPDPRFESLYDSMRDGLIDEGWKDVVIVMPGERVRVLMQFLDYVGLYLYHCHILEHEDLGMMRNYEVRA